MPVKIPHTRLRQICEKYGVNMENARLADCTKGTERYEAALAIRRAADFENLHRIIDRLEDDPAVDAAHFIDIVDEAIKNDC